MIANRGTKIIVKENDLKKEENRVKNRKKIKKQG
jgi:hypothetical protein